MPLHNDLPKFENPPVVETVLGVQFVPVENLTNAHLGVFWAELRDQWPTVKVVPPLEEQFERFDEQDASWTAKVLQLRITQDLTARYMIGAEAKDRMLQVQRNRFHYNWLGGHVGQKYPSYDYVRPAFDEEYARFRSFVDGNSLGDVSPNQWEVTYVNHIPKHPKLWQEPKDWTSLFPTTSIMEGELEGLRLEGIQVDWHYEIEPKRGRLHVQLFSGRKDSDEGKKDLLVMKLTARGSVDSEMGLDLGAGLDLGHETIVRSFNSLISKDARKHWRGPDGDA